MKLNKAYFDILAIISVLVFLSEIFILFNIKLPLIAFIPFQFIAVVLLFLTMIFSQISLKKWGWVGLALLIVIGLIFNFIGATAGYNDYLDTLSSEQAIELAREGGLSGSISMGMNPPEDSLNKIFYYGGYSIYLLGLLSLILYYYRFYRKYLADDTSNNNKTIPGQNIGKTYNKIVTWLIFILIFLLVVFFILKSIFKF